MKLYWTIRNSEKHILRNFNDFYAIAALIRTHHHHTNAERRRSKREEEKKNMHRLTVEALCSTAKKEKKHTFTHTTWIRFQYPNYTGKTTDILQFLLLTKLFSSQFAVWSALHMGNHFNWLACILWIFRWSKFCFFFIGLTESEC